MYTNAVKSGLMRTDLVLHAKALGDQSKLVHTMV